MAEADKKINLSGFALGSSVIGACLYIFPKLLNMPNWGFGSILKVTIIFTALSAGLMSGLVLGFVIWLLFRVSKSAVYRIHYILVSLFGLFAGFEFMRFLDKSGVFLQ